MEDLDQAGLLLLDKGLRELVVEEWWVELLEEEWEELL